jgi:hypothetical protein
VPLVAFEPDHEPDAVQVSAFIDDHVSVAVWPVLALIDVRSVVRVTVGTVVTVTVTCAVLVIPLGLVQVM